MNILLVEDNVSIAEDIVDYLLQDKVFHSENIAWSYEILKNNNIDFAIIDWMLPDWEWIELCKHIKQINPQLWVIMATARWQLDDKVEGFESGADDYLTKPFDLKELEIRINAISKRKPEQNWVFFRRNFKFDLEKQVVTSWEKILTLTNIEFLILKMLIQAKWWVVSRTQILDEIWWDEGLWWWDNKLDVYISGLRKKIDKDFIVTQKWAGYKIWN